MRKWWVEYIPIHKGDVFLERPKRCRINGEYYSIIEAKKAAKRQLRKASKNLAIEKIKINLIFVQE